MQGVVLGLPADEFCERLSHDANGFGLISSLGKVELCGAQDSQRVGDLPVESSGVKTNKCSNRPDIGLRIGLRVNKARLQYRPRRAKTGQKQTLESCNGALGS